MAKYPDVSFDVMWWTCPRCGRREPVAIRYLYTRTSESSVTLEAKMFPNINDLVCARCGTKCIKKTSSQK